MPRFSIITASFNSQAHIADTIQSVKMQQGVDFEHLIIDGCSSDNTSSVVMGLMHPSLTFYSDPDKGVYDAMNNGAIVSSGEIVTFLNSDDYYAVDTALKQVGKVFEDSTVDVCYANLDYVSKSNEKRIIRKWRSRSFKPGLFSKGWCPAHPTFFIRRSALDNVGLFDLSYPIGNDVEWMMRALEVKRLRSVFIPNVLVKMRIGGISNSSLAAVLTQNLTIIKALKKFNLWNGFANFIFHKLISRIVQRFG